MSLTHESRMLELESQTALLERLQLLTNFGSNLVTIGGPGGAGKSWLAQRYLEAWAEEKNQSLLMCHPNQDEAQRRATILGQLVSQSQYNPSDTILESFSRAQENEPCDIVIVVDDAHLLSETFISELWMMVLEAQVNPTWTVNVVLFAQSGSLDALLTRLSYGQEHKPIDLEVDNLSENEADRFFEHLVMRYVEDGMERRTRNAYRKTNRTPGDIMALADQKVEKRIIIRSIIGSPINIALAILVIVLLIGGGYWYMTQQPTPDEMAQQLTDNVEQTVIPTLPEVEEPQTAQVEGENIEAIAEDPMVAEAVEDTDALPQELMDGSVLIGGADAEQQRVVITSEVVDALMEGKPEQVDTSVIETAVEDAKEQAVENPVEVPVEEPQAEVSEATPETRIQFSFSREELKAYSPRSYTLQLAAMNTLQEVQQFIDKYRLAGQVYVYPTVRSEVEWYIVTYQNYPTIQMARDAVDGLSEELQSLEPWAKSLSQVQREIDRAN
ncbi:SPOR domain-containing protein [Vibrio sonorensis]|uniref:SPOR domain-containing protein n=1 Tax=Vibrio sonorensis TaxID=1004316 RepID=UPI0008D94ADF|nr:AAA family ATPase [Vibrio sonorensis]